MPIRSNTLPTPLPVSRSSSQNPFKEEAVEMSTSVKSLDGETQQSAHDHHGEVDSYFTGPRDLSHHSRWPTFLRIHGSVLPRMVLPIAFVAVWSSAITAVAVLVHDIGINHVLLTVMGFVVGLSLSFRSSTAYERYNDGRKYWAQLNQVTQNLARLVWIHADERKEVATEDLLAKITFCNMLAAFAVALKHRLRFEPFTHYEDLEPRLRHLPILAKSAVRRDWTDPSPWKLAGLVLGLPMAESNPRKLVKNPRKPLGNVPLEILASCSAYIKTIIDNGTFKAPSYQTQSMALVAQMHDILTGTDRVLNTPLPIAYSIAISQITWVYILVLPFQLTDYLGWAAIPATVFAAYIILGISIIGAEIENPFGEDVNDLPLDSFCEQIRQDIDLLLCQAPDAAQKFIANDNNALLYPLSNLGFNALKTKSADEIRAMLRSKPELTFKAAGAE